ncbi:Acyl-CoA dehydrogenase [Pseudomonas pohangensis]|jgi:alkylation response protein AidB-like acyl-CoA dehydrogenase|uniref:Medium-chain specific acyl-CoA dehydrogenase, mitochondrial n=1 Tax=Pseudomonas pohangensis TaxID=364197 RepID=A0A1H2FK22_9PSED|nr:acyl-CoA dehydrogenase [Pseudomonas pohangensis]SDU07681.1 Acyl-CoA dehydrogenase [Pseudomonas pohangensis]
MDYQQLPLSGLEAPLNEMEQMIQDNVHHFAQSVMREAGVTLDQLSPEQAIAPDSVLWDVLQKAEGLGLNLTALAELPPLERVKLFGLATEELAWGDGGLAGSILVNYFPVMYSLLAGNLAMAEFCEGKRGCWGITEPDHGSDMVDPSAAVAAPGMPYGRPNCLARIVGDKVIINGQKAAWVSGAMTAEVCALFCHYADEQGNTRPGVAVIVPLDLPGVSRGKPLDKLGVRGMNQGELYFDNVEVPLANLLAGPDQYQDLAYRMLCEANPHVGMMAVGMARAAYEHALAYAHERKQGGQPLIRHQHVRFRLFEMFRKVEAARALVRRVMDYNATAAYPSLLGSTSAKVTATQTAFEVASDALQMFGGNGLTREYPMEKLFRDARAMLIADGANEMLAIKGGSDLINPELL